MAVYARCRCGQSLLIFWLPQGVQLCFQNRKSNTNEEFKRDGLLMLEFSNSQSRKEFTAQ
jgi:hypothetical protein